MKLKPNFEKEFNLAIKPNEGTPSYADFGSPAEHTAGETEQASPSSKWRKSAANLTTPNGTEAEIGAVCARDDPRYVGSNETDLRNEQTTL